MAVNLEITGNIRDRFVQAATLLYLLDPVRGEPTTYGLDQDAPDLQAPKEQALKRKFLDSFALICATRQDGDAVSAACLEEGEPEGTVIRIASNAGISDETLSQLQSILGLLSGVSNEVPDQHTTEIEVLAKIVQLDIAKIRKYVRNLQKSKGAFEEGIASLESRLVEVLPDDALPSIQRFLEWFGKIYRIQTLLTEPGPGVLLSYIRWAQKAKPLYRNLLIAAFSRGDQPLPRWVLIILKLGRYGIAAKVLILTAIELPALFNPVLVEPLPAPPRAKLLIRDEVPLTCALRRMAEIRPEIAIPRLASIWNTNDAESFFRKACPKDLVAHAELQIINLFDHNPQRRPYIRFIGISKKSCYLCLTFLTAHPSGFHVSSCHQKIYPSWIVPPAVDVKIYRQNKAITADISKKMEAIARQDLLRGLGLRRFPIPADSTAGVSLTGLTDTTSLEVIDFEEHDESYVDFGIDMDAGHHEPILNATVPDSEAVSHSADLTPQIPDLQQVNINSMSLPRTCQQFAGQDSQMPISSMVFHFKCHADKTWQDIVMIGSVLDPATHSPSWSKLVVLLKKDDDFGIVFQNSNVLVINGDIWVRNERQFTACLQYLLNSGCF